MLLVLVAEIGFFTLGDVYTVVIKDAGDALTGILVVKHIFESEADRSFVHIDLP